MKNTPTLTEQTCCLVFCFWNADVLISLWFLDFLIYNSFLEIEENTFATLSYVIFYFGSKFNAYSEVKFELNQTNIRLASLSSIPPGYCVDALGYE